jgi:hypothetical protein
MLQALQRFGNHCSCHLQGEWEVVCERPVWQNRGMGRYPVGSEDVVVEKR